MDDAGQCLVQHRDEFRQSCVVTIVCGLKTHVVPDRFDGVEFWAVGWQQTKMEAMSVMGQPLAHLWSLVVRRVIVDEENLLMTIPLRQAREKGRITLAFEHVSMSEVELGPVKVHRAENLLRVPLAGRGN